MKFLSVFLIAIFLIAIPALWAQKESLDKDDYIKFLEEENRKLRDQLNKLLDVLIGNWLNNSPQSDGSYFTKERLDSMIRAIPQPIKPDFMDYYQQMQMAWEMMKNQMMLETWPIQFDDPESLYRYFVLFPWFRIR